MFSLKAIGKGVFGRLFALLLGLALGIGAAQNAPNTLNPGQSTPPANPTQNQPGKLPPPGSSPVQSIGPERPTQNDATEAQANANQPQPPPVVFESHGLEYDAITKNGITVMFAQLPSRLRDFSIIQITVTNGSLVSWTVKPSDFTFVRADGTTLIADSADYVVAELLQRANRDDVIKLQLLYENTIYGLSNYRPSNGYEKRREAAMAQFVNRGFKAAAEASALAFTAIKLKPGDSTDGAIFFENRTKEKGLGAGRLLVHTCGETFIFETYAELKKR